MTALDFPAHLNDQTHVILNINETLDAYVNHWDPYPFILMNLVLSM